MHVLEMQQNETKQLGLQPHLWWVKEDLNATLQVIDESESCEYESHYIQHLKL